MGSLIKRLLSEPLAADLDLDDPKLTAVRRVILRKKPFLRAVYSEWYQLLSRSVPAGSGRVIELGSGSGFAGESVPGLISSEIFWLPDISLVFDGCALPFPDQSLKAILMTDVLHHIPTVRSFFAEASRCLVPGGVVAMVEPWVSGWSRFVYRNFHHEPFQPETPAWEFATSGPLSGANGALPWIVFQRDRAQFARDFPCLAVETVRPMMPFCFLLSGGLSMRGLAPAFSYPWVRVFEGWLERGRIDLGMFSFILLRRDAGC